jgi:uncharacterized protein
VRALALILAWLAALTALPATAQDFPQLTGRVVDAANIIPPDVEASLDAKLAALETQSQRQLVVATVPDLQGYEISDYGYQLGRHWGIGQKATNEGAILLVAPNERKVRIEVGYGLEPVLTDGLSSLIIQNDILPRFKAGDMPGGIVAGTDAIIKQLQLPADQAQQVAAQAAKASEDRGGGIPIGTIVWIVFVLFFFVLPMFRGNRGGRAYRRGGMGGALGNIIMWEAGKSIARGLNGGGGGGWGGGGGFGGGGFSGGGGSFGGGGASGGW